MLVYALVLGVGMTFVAVTFYILGFFDCCSSLNPTKMKTDETDDEEREDSGENDYYEKVQSSYDRQNLRLRQGVNIIPDITLPRPGPPGRVLLYSANFNNPAPPPAALPRCAPHNIAPPREKKTTTPISLKSTAQLITQVSPAVEITKTSTDLCTKVSTAGLRNADTKVSIGGLRGSTPLIQLVNRMSLLAEASSTSSTQDTMSTVTESIVLNDTTPQITSAAQEESPAVPVIVAPPALDACPVISNLPRHAVLPSLQLKDLSLDIVLGGGGFGQVWRGNWRGTPVAVKILSASCQSSSVPDQILQAFEEEVEMLASLRHPNICMFLGVCMNPPNRAIVTELVSRGSLWDVLRSPNSVQSQQGQVFHWPTWAIRKVLDCTCRGIIYMHNHSPSIIHRDLKSANLLLDDAFNVKICDFGLARLKDYTTVMTANVGTVQWMAPEVLTGQAYSESADIYSLGMIIWETLTGKCPYEGMTCLEVAMAVVQQGVRPTIPPSCSQAQAALIQMCWCTRAEERLNATEVLTRLESAFPLSVT